MTERLQKIISAAGICSRRAAEGLILSGRVSVNGAAAVLGQSADKDADEILVDGMPIRRLEAPVYIMLNKPRGYVTTMSDEFGRRTVWELVAGCGSRVYPVGRLDMNSEGLLILTNDGAAAYKLAHPSGEVKKTYRTSVEGEDIEASAEILRREMELDGRRIRGAEVRTVSQGGGGAVLLITIGEGRNRQIRRMCDQAGLKVKRLCRVSEGELLLGGLRPGKWRYLTEEESQYLSKR